MGSFRTAHTPQKPNGSAGRGLRGGHVLRWSALYRRLCAALEVAWQWNHEGGGVSPALAQLFVLAPKPELKLKVDE